MSAATGLGVSVDGGHPSQRTSVVWSRVLLLAALVFHLSLLVSWRAGFWNRFTFDSTATQGWRGWDFYALYQAGHNVLTGVSVYESDNDAIDVVVPRYTPYRYLPFSAYTLGVALNALSPLWAFRAWVTVVVVVWWACAWASYRLGGSPGERAILAALWLLFTPFYLEIYLGQFSAIQAAFVLAMLLACMDSASGWAVDAGWAASLVWKQNTALLGPALLRGRRWRALLVGALAMMATSLPYFWRYPDSVARFAVNLASGVPSPQLGNLGVRQFLYSVASAAWPALPSEAHRLMQSVWVVAILVIGLLITFTGRCRDLVLALCFWFTTYFLVYHHVWEHHYVMLLPVFVVLYYRYRAPWVLVAWALVAVWTPYVLIDSAGMAAYHAPMRWTPLDPPVLDILYHASKAVPTLGLWAAQAWLMARSAPATQSC